MGLSSISVCIGWQPRMVSIFFLKIWKNTYGKHSFANTCIKLWGSSKWPQLSAEHKSLCQPQFCPCKMCEMSYRHLPMKLSFPEIGVSTFLPQASLILFWFFGFQMHCTSWDRAGQGHLWGQLRGLPQAEDRWEDTHFHPPAHLHWLSSSNSLDWKRKRELLPPTPWVGNREERWARVVEEQKLAHHQVREQHLACCQVPFRLGTSTDTRMGGWSQQCPAHQGEPRVDWAVLRRHSCPPPV